MPHRGIYWGVKCRDAAYYWKRATQERTMIRVVKRYGSRKLYDTEESRYVSLEEIGDWSRDGQEVRVLDNTTEEDVTAQTLMQVILEEGKRGGSVFSSDILH